MDWNYTTTYGGSTDATEWDSNMTSPTTVRNRGLNSTVVQPVFSLDWNVEVNNMRSYSFLIVLLSIAVVMAVLFVLFGLFMKAGAHTIDATLTSTGTSLQNALGGNPTSQNSYSNLLKDEFSLFVDDDGQFMEC